MANTTASVLITRALDNASRISTGTTRSGATLETMALYWLNNTMVRMSRFWDFRELYVLSSGVAGTSVTVASTKTYAFPTNWKAIIDIRIIDGFSSRKLRMRTPRMLDKMVPYPENYTTRRPQWYTPLGNNFDIFPIPDAVYTMPIRHIKWPTTISSTATTIDYEPTKDDIVVAGMTGELFGYLQMYEDEQKWKVEFQRLLRDAKMLEEHNPDWDPVGKGFDSSYDREIITEFWNDPFIRDNI